MLIQAHTQQGLMNVAGDKDKETKPISIDPKTWVKLGHFHLLLEEFNKGRRSPLPAKKKKFKKKLHYVILIK